MKKDKNTFQKGEIFEIGIVYKRPLFSTMKTIKSSQEANVFLRENIDLDAIDLKEFFWVILLNNSNKVLGFSEIGRGDTTSVVVNVKEIFQLILKTNSSAIVIGHNHPSGKLSPSLGDKNITTKIKNACHLFSIKLVDHIIITSEKYLSFVDEGVL